MKRKARHVVACVLALSIVAVAGTTSARESAPADARLLRVEVVEQERPMTIYVDGIATGQVTPAEVSVRPGEMVSAGGFTYLTWLVQGDEQFVRFRLEKTKDEQRLFVDVGRGEGLLGITAKAWTESIRLDARLLHRGGPRQDEEEEAEPLSESDLRSGPGILGLHAPAFPGLRPRSTLPVIRPWGRPPVGGSPAKEETKQPSRFQQAAETEGTIRLLNSGACPVRDLGSMALRVDLWALNLHGNELSDVASLRDLHELRILDLSRAEPQDWSPLAELKRLRVLVLQGSSISDLTPLAGLAELRELELPETTDLRPLGALSRLRFLSLTWKGSDLAPLGELTALEELRFNATRAPVDLSPLGRLAALKRLQLDLQAPTDLSPLGRLAKLERLELSLSAANVAGLAALGASREDATREHQPVKATDFSPLAGTIALRDLDVSNTEIADLSFLTRATRLQRLDASQTKIRSLHGLENARELFRANLAGAPVEDIGALRDLRKLTWLDLSDSQVEDIGVLKNLRGLTMLNLSDSQVEDLRPLARLASLETLNLTSTPVGDLRPLQGLKQLKTLDVSKTAVRDLRPLAAVKSLKNLTVSATIQPGELKWLQKRLPDCSIQTDEPPKPLLFPRPSILRR